MINIAKGLLVLPVVALGVGAVYLAWALAVGAIGLLAVAACVVVPYLLRLVVIASIVLVPLWLLGKIVTELTHGIGRY